jgi:hypothetical protein
MRRFSKLATQLSSSEQMVFSAVKQQFSFWPFLLLLLLLPLLTPATTQEVFEQEQA